MFKRKLGLGILHHEIIYVKSSEVEHSYKNKQIENHMNENLAAAWSEIYLDKGNGKQQMYKRNRVHLHRFLKERSFQNRNREMLEKTGYQTASREKIMQSIAAAELMRCFSRGGKLPAQRMTEKYWCTLILVIPISPLENSNKRGKRALKKIWLHYTNPWNTWVYIHVSC